MVEKCENRKFYGSTIIGEKGQVVIPKEARDDLNFRKSDKILVFGTKNMIVLIKFSDLKKFMNYLEKDLRSLKKITQSKKYDKKNYKNFKK